MEAALLTDPENSELLKLKQDLEEVIELTRDLIQTQLAEQKKSSYVEPSRSKSETHSSRSADAEPSRSTSNSNSPYLGGGSGEAASTSDPYYDEIEAALLAAEQSVKATKTWKIGDKCQAKWTEDGNYYDATIEGISATGEVNVIFDAYQNRSSTTLAELKERVVRNEVFPSTK